MNGSIYLPAQDSSQPPVRQTAMPPHHTGGQAQQWHLSTEVGRGPWQGDICRYLSASLRPILFTVTCTLVPAESASAGLRDPCRANAILLVDLVCPLPLSSLSIPTLDGERGTRLSSSPPPRDSD
jgi:hypothetical protein